MSIAVDQWPKRHRIDVDQYYKMAEVGLLAPDARTELIEGEVIDMAPIGVSHARTVHLLSKWLYAHIGEQAELIVQLPVRLGSHSEPQPDLTLLKASHTLYKQSHPTAADVLLIIEVSDTTIKFDRGEKLGLYAKHGIPEVWVIDLNDKRLHRARDPQANQYRTTDTLTPSQIVAPAALPDLRLELSQLFS